MQIDEKQISHEESLLRFNQFNEQLLYRIKSFLSSTSIQTFPLWYQVNCIYLPQLTFRLITCSFRDPCLTIHWYIVSSSGRREWISSDPLGWMADLPSNAVLVALNFVWLFLILATWDHLPVVLSLNRHSNVPGLFLVYCGQARMTSELWQPFWLWVVTALTAPGKS